MKNEIILYRPNELAEHIEVRFDEDTAWLTQAQIAELFGTKRPAITKHLKNIFDSGELDENVVCSKMELTTQHGAITGKEQTGSVKIYNLDAIISVGYRVSSRNATLFRIWATKQLKNYLLKGYAIAQRFRQKMVRFFENGQDIGSKYYQCCFGVDVKKELTREATVKKSLTVQKEGEVPHKYKEKQNARNNYRP